MSKQESIVELETGSRQNAESQNEIDRGKRSMLFGLGALSGLLQACDPKDRIVRDDTVLPRGQGGSESAPSSPSTAAGPAPSETVTSSSAGGTNSVNTVGVDQVGVDCTCMPPGAPGTGAPGAGAPGTGTGTGTPTTPTPGATPSLSPRFRSIPGPGVELNSFDMMTSTTFADGRTLTTWGFQTSAGLGFNGDRLLPSPVLELVEGMPSQLVFGSMMPHTIHLHGLDVNQANDGVPSTSGYVANPTGMFMPGFGRVNGLPLLPSPHTYSFVAPHAGTYMYHCHVDTVLHMEMGMSGTIIVRPPDGSANMLWANGPVFDVEYIWQLHTIDSTWHTQRQSSTATARYRPDYFLINGRDGANLLTDSATAINAAANEIVLIRLVNLGYLPAVVNLGGLTFSVVSSDGRPLRQTITATDFLIGPGERYDVLFTMPATSPGNATVTYMNIRGVPIPNGVAVTTITTV